MIKLTLEEGTNETDKIEFQHVLGKLFVDGSLESRAGLIEVINDCRKELIVFQDGLLDTRKIIDKFVIE